MAERAGHPAGRSAGRSGRYRPHRRGGQRASGAHDYLFTTGGIGPTHDDITVDAIAAAFGVPVIVHPEARAILEDYYRDRPGGLTEARLGWRGCPRARS